jgi:hypothetical protein
MALHNVAAGGENPPCLHSIQLYPTEDIINPTEEKAQELRKVTTID